MTLHDRQGRPRPIECGYPDEFGRPCTLASDHEMPCDGSPDEPKDFGGLGHSFATEAAPRAERVSSQRPARSSPPAGGVSEEPALISKKAERGAPYSPGAGRRVDPREGNPGSARDEHGGRSASPALAPPDRIVVAWCRACGLLVNVSLPGEPLGEGECRCPHIAQRIVRVRYQLTRQQGRLKRNGRTT